MRIYCCTVLALAVATSLYWNSREGIVMAAICVPGLFAAGMMPYWLGSIVIDKVRQYFGKVETSVAEGGHASKGIVEVAGGCA